MFRLKERKPRSFYVFCVLAVWMFSLLRLLF
uniref:Uncharacterized protein n=1 Tax=Rhizophora mucronata TaxID=61149 RepID=A0A2P2Q140_RHIMU